MDIIHLPTQLFATLLLSSPSLSFLLSLRTLLTTRRPVLPKNAASRLYVALMFKPSFRIIVDPPLARTPTPSQRVMHLIKFSFSHGVSPRSHQTAVLLDSTRVLFLHLVQLLSLRFISILSFSFFSLLVSHTYGSLYSSYFLRFFSFRLGNNCLRMYSSHIFA